MSQEYTPVDWVDETTSQQGTLITAARLDQMQTAHHFTDGFEEVDAVPTADPGVDYHKVVFCTADTTFYRWDGSQWVKDVDDTTAAELAAHEADHDNPHQVTKAQVGLGNVDNTSDLNKPVSGPQQTALNNKADKTQLSDGSVTKVGTATVGAMNTPIFLDAGVPTEGYMPLYNVNGQGGPGAYLTGKDIPWTDTQSPPSVADRLTAIDGAIYDLNAHAVQVDENGDVIGAIGALEVRGALTINGADLTVAEESGTGGSITAKTLDTTGAVTIGGTLAVTGAITGSLTGNVTGNADTATSATKLGTVDVGTDTKPIKLVAGVPTAVGHDLVTLDTAQTITANKTFNNIILSSEEYNLTSIASTSGASEWWAVYTSREISGTYYDDVLIIVTKFRTGFSETNSRSCGVVQLSYSPSNAGYLSWLVCGSGINPANFVAIKSNNRVLFCVRGITNINNGFKFAMIGKNDYFSVDTRVLTAAESALADAAASSSLMPLITNTPGSGAAANEVATVGFIDGYAPMVRTTGNQTIAGVKTFNNQIEISQGIGLMLDIKRNNVDRTSAFSSYNDIAKIRFKDQNDKDMFWIDTYVDSGDRRVLQLQVMDKNGVAGYIQFVNTGDGVKSIATNFPKPPTW